MPLWLHDLQQSWSTHGSWLKARLGDSPVSPALERFCICLMLCPSTALYFHSLSFWWKTQKRTALEREMSPHSWLWWVFLLQAPCFWLAALGGFLRQQWLSPATSAKSQPPPLLPATILQTRQRKWGEVGDQRSFQQRKKSPAAAANAASLIRHTLLFAPGAKAREVSW